jgi:UDP-GlcNAc3NAcA epimerase
MKVLSIVGTRPQFLKLAPLSQQFEMNGVNHIVVHSGQHYDKEMSEDIFDVLNMKTPDYLLEKSESVGIDRLCTMMKNIEKICLNELPDKIVVFGDCDTTLAGSLVAKNLKIYLIHIESGMRSYNKSMPEEINRLISDHVSDLLLCSTKDSIDKLNNENIKNNAYYVGNLQLELLKNVSEKYNNKQILIENKLTENKYALMTIHRDYNTNKYMLESIFSELTKLTVDIVFPIHPRTKNVIEQNNIQIPENIKLIQPVHYLDMTILERFCCYIITDSGGIQPEAWFLKKKCIIMRSETEWIETLENNNNILYDYTTPLGLFIEQFLKIDIIDINIDLCASKNIYNLII